MALTVVSADSEVRSSGADICVEQVAVDCVRSLLIEHLFEAVEMGCPFSRIVDREEETGDSMMMKQSIRVVCLFVCRVSCRLSSAPKKQDL